MSAAVAGTTSTTNFRPTASYTTLRDVTICKVNETLSRVPVLSRLATNIEVIAKAPLAV